MAHGALNLGCPCIVPFRGLVVELDGGEVRVYRAWRGHTHRAAVVQIGATI